MDNRERPPNAEQLNQLLLEELKDVGVFSMDLERRITSWSPGVERILGFGEMEFIGQDATILFTPEDLQTKTDDAEFERARLEGRAPDMRWHMRKNGTRVFIEGVLRAVTDDEGRHVGYTKIFRDIRPSGVGAHTLGAILDRTPDAIYIRDWDGRYAYVNSEAMRVLGRTSEEILGHTPEEFFPAHISRAIRENNAKVMDSNAPIIIEEQIVTCNDGKRTFLSGKAPWRDSDGNTIGVACIDQDISARKRSEEEREQLLGELRRSNEDLAQFSHVVSHDLQAPLRTVNSYTQLLSQRYQGQLDETAKQFIAVILNGVAGMEQLIRALLSYAQVGEEPLRRTSVRVDAILDGVRSNLQPLIEETSTQLIYGPLPAVLGDPVQILQLFQNIVANAIKYARAGVIPQINISAERTEDGGYRFAISDNGSGIDPKNFERIFAPLKRLHGKEIPGNGIGLAICKKIVERHGGQR